MTNENALVEEDDQALHEFAWIHLRSSRIEAGLLRMPFDLHTGIFFGRQDQHNPLGGAAQSQGIFRSAGPQANTEAANQRVELVGEGQRRALRRARNLVLDALGKIVIVDRLRDFLAFVLMPGVESADLALQFGELLHELGGQVALAKFRGARDLCLFRVQIRSDGSR